MTAQPYQLFDPLRPEEYDALKADIAKRGIQIPIEVDDAGAILDGHHRARIATELGIDCPKVIRTFVTEAEKREHVIKLNLARRHLDPIRWGQAFAKLLEVRGVQVGQGARNDKTSATVAEVAVEVGVPARTARQRLRQARRYEALPEDGRARVDGGERVSKVESDLKRAERREHALAWRRERDTKLTKGYGRPGWTRWGLDASEGPDVIPLERFWSSERSKIAGYAESVRALTRSLRKDRQMILPGPDRRVRDVPGVLEAFAHLDEAIEAVGTVLEDAAAGFESIAESASARKILPLGGGTPERDAELLAANARQKNAIGYCGEVGCWQHTDDELCYWHRPVIEDVMPTSEELDAIKWALQKGLATPDDFPSKVRGMLAEAVTS